MNEGTQVELTGSQKDKLTSCYIQRRLTNTLIDFQFVKDLPKNTFVIISKVKNYSWMQVEILNASQISNVHISTNDISEEDFTNISLKNPTKCIHHLRYLSKRRLEWIRSKNCSNKPETSEINHNCCLEKLEKFRLENEYTTIHESELFGERESNINIICAPPGSGKSAMVKNLKNNATSDTRVAIVSARNLGRQLNKFGANVDKFIKHIWREQLKEENKETKELDRFLGKNQIKLIWDGLDEVSEEILKIILDLVKAVSNKGIKQWLTSRNNLKSRLERRFNSFSRNLCEFNEEKQEEYVCNRLKLTDDTEFSKIFQEIKPYVEMCSSVNLLGIPLQLFILTEILSQNMSKYLKLLKNGLFTTFDLYKHFVNERFKIHFEEKRNLNLKIDLADFEKKQQSQLALYQKTAFDLHLKSGWAKTIPKLSSRGSKFSKFIEETISRGDQLGFIKQASNFDEVQFVHTSYGEYFAALYLFENNPKMARDPSFISNEKLNTVRFFLDLMLAQNPKLVAAIVYQKYGLTDDLNTRDSIGRNLLELSCAWNRSFSILSFTKDAEFNSSLNDRNIKVLNFQNIKKMFDRIRAKSPSQKESLLYFPFLIPLYDNTRQDFDPNHLPQILTHALKLDSTHLFDLIQNSPGLKESYDKNIKPESLLALALICKSRHVLDKILLSVEYRLLLLTKLRDFLKRLPEDHSTIFKYLINLKNFDGKMPIHCACVKSDLKTVKWLLDNDSKVNVLDKSGQLPIHYASQQYKFEIVKLLVNFKSELNVPDKNGDLPIHFMCAFEDNHDILKLLLENDAKVNVPDSNGFLPIHHACQNMDGYETAKLLVEKGSEINPPDPRGILPLHYAIENIGTYELVNLLLQKGAKVNDPGFRGVRPIHYACQCYSHEIVELLLENGAEINVPDDYGYLPISYVCETQESETVKLLLDFKSEVNVPNSRGCLPIHTACNIEGSYEIIKLLLENDAKVNVPNSDGYLPIHYACQYGDCYVVVKLLVENGAEINVPDPKGVLPLHYAIENAYGFELVKLLLEKGAKVNEPDSTGWRPMHYACFHTSIHGPEIVKMLFEKGAEINIPDQDGYFPISYACENHNVETVELFVNLKSEINVPNNKGCLPIHIACGIVENYEMIKLLLENGAKVNAPALNGFLPIHYACQNGYDGDETVKLLLENGAEINVPDSKGFLPLDYAYENKYGSKIVQVLLKNGAKANVHNLETARLMHCEDQDESEWGAAEL